MLGKHKKKWHGHYANTLQQRTCVQKPGKKAKYKKTITQRIKKFN